MRLFTILLLICYVCSSLSMMSWTSSFFKKDLGDSLPKAPMPPVINGLDWCPDFVVDRIPIWHNIAYQYVSDALTLFQTGSPEIERLFIRWFDANDDPNNMNDVADWLTKLKTRMETQAISYQAGRKCKSGSPLFAVNPSLTNFTQQNEIVFCKGVLQVDNDNPVYIASTLVHELFHCLGLTDNFAGYGSESLCLDLAKNSPADAIVNPASYGFFVREISGKQFSIKALNEKYINDQQGQVQFTKTTPTIFTCIGAYPNCDQVQTGSLYLSWDVSTKRLLLSSTDPSAIKVKWYGTGLAYLKPVGSADWYSIDYSWQYVTQIVSTLLRPTTSDVFFDVRWGIEQGAQDTARSYKLKNAQSQVRLAYDSQSNLVVDDTLDYTWMTYGGVDITYMSVDGTSWINNNNAMTTPATVSTHTVPLHRNDLFSLKQANVYIITDYRLQGKNQVFILCEDSAQVTWQSYSVGSVPSTQCTWQTI